jgi:thiamine-phosphate pyrophosphorylase
MAEREEEGRGRPARPDLAEKLAVYLVADPEATGRDLVEDAIAALDGGVTCVQLRAKRMADGDAWRLAIRLREQCRYRGALFIVNDRVDLALAAQADGVHLGVRDLPLAMARWIAGPGFVLGYSPTTVAEAASAVRQGADYVGAGPVFATASKADAGAPIGVAGLAERVEAAGLPTVGIGGITAENAGEVIRAGAVGVSVIGAILGADDPGAAAARLAAAVRAARGGG